MKCKRSKSKRGRPPKQAKPSQSADFMCSAPCFARWLPEVAATAHFALAPSAFDGFFAHAVSAPSMASRGRHQSPQTLEPVPPKQTNRFQGSRFSGLFYLHNFSLHPCIIRDSKYRVLYIRTSFVRTEHPLPPILGGAWPNYRAASRRGFRASWQRGRYSRYGCESGRRCLSPSQPDRLVSVIP